MGPVLVPQVLLLSLSFTEAPVNNITKDREV